MVILSYPGLMAFFYDLNYHYDKKVKKLEEYKDKINILYVALKRILILSIFININNSRNFLNPGLCYLI